MKYRRSFFQELRFETIFYLPLYFCMQEMYNLTFVYLKNFVLLYFWTPDSGFRNPDSSLLLSGFQISHSWFYGCPSACRVVEFAAMLKVFCPKQSRLKG